MNCYLGIDFGTSGARAIVLDEHAQVVEEVSQRFDHTPTQNQAAYWRQVLFHLVQQVPLPVRSEMRAIAINGTSSTVMLCDLQGPAISPSPAV
jgi:sugar (pentulose or hexulose) kinase